MAKPVPGALNKPVESGLKEITPEPARSRAHEPTIDLAPDEPYDQVPPTLDVEPEALADPAPPDDDEPAALIEAQPIAPAPAPPSDTAGGASEELAPPEPDMPATVHETLQAVDDSWRAFHARAARFPSERMDERLGEDGWTRKQMLAHVAAWHDLTADRLLKFYNTGQPPEFNQDVNEFNAMVARRAVGKTAGEVLNDTEATFNRLRRQLQRLSDVQLRQFDHWAAWVIKGNTYGHYEEHWQDVNAPEPPPGSAARR
jgi:hypothetical protein